MTVRKRTNDKPFFDTNVLLYAFQQQDQRCGTAQQLLAKGGVVSVQTLNEFASVARRKLELSWAEVFEALAAIRVLCPLPVPLRGETHERALRIAERYGYGIYDSMVLSAALESDCSVLFSEDMHDGQIIEGLTIRNPFRSVPRE